MPLTADRFKLKTHSLEKQIDYSLKTLDSVLCESLREQSQILGRDKMQSTENKRKSTFTVSLIKMATPWKIETGELDSVDWWKEELNLRNNFSC